MAGQKGISAKDFSVPFSRDREKNFWVFSSGTVKKFQKSICNVTEVIDNNQFAYNKKKLGFISVYF